MTPRPLPPPAPEPTRYSRHSFPMTVQMSAIIALPPVLLRAVLFHQREEDILQACLAATRLLDLNSTLHQSRDDWRHFTC